MLEVSFVLNREERIQSFAVSGHSQYAEHGKDIVCAAVSVLAQSAVIGLEEYVGIRPRVTRQSGGFSCLLPQKMTDRQVIMSEAILRTCYLGMLAVQENYAGYVKIEVIKS